MEHSSADTVRRRAAARKGARTTVRMAQARAAAAAQPGPAEAKARALVLLPDGRTGRLLWAPAAKRCDRTRALVVVDGRHVHVPVTELRVAPA